VTTQPAAGDTHDDSLVPIAVEALTSYFPLHNDVQLHQAAAGVLAALRPHIDAENTRLRDALAAIATICEHHAGHGEWSGWMDEIREVLDAEGIAPAAGGNRPPADPAGKPGKDTA